jgi:hypothetical protein
MCSVWILCFLISAVAAIVYGAASLCYYTELDEYYTTTQFVQL